MNNLKVRLSERVMAILLAMLMGVNMLPLTAFAATASELTTNIGQKTFKVGVPTEFTFTTIANDDEGVIVVGTSDFSDPDAIEKLEYLEIKDGNWYDFSGDFGPATGFPMTDATSTFRVTFKTPGDYSFNASIKSVENEELLCSTDVAFTVTGKENSTLSTDIGEREFVVGEPTEFTFTTTANDYIGVMVLGSYDFSDESAIEKLEYYEAQNGEWYELKGNFGPSTGFPMSDATSKFRVTFIKAGDFSFTASMKYADGDNAGEVLCASDEIAFHVKNKYNITVEQTGNGTLTLNDEVVGKDGLVVVEGEEVALAVEPEEGWIISAVSVNGEQQNLTDNSSFTETITVTDKDIKINVTFVKLYKVTVEYASEKGAVVTEPESIGGSVTVVTGTSVDITATPNATYRVSKVEITDAKIIDFADNTYNSDNPYKTNLTVDKDHTVAITFAPLVYNITVEKTTNGTVSVSKNSVDYGDSVLITIEPKNGYAIDTATVNDISIYSSLIETDDDSLVEFVMKDICENKNISVAFKKCEAAVMDNVSWNSEEALRHNAANNLYIFKKDTKVTFKTGKQGIRITDKDGNTYGGILSKSASISKSTQIKKIELRYNFSWHEVLIDDTSVNLQIAFDTGKPIVDVKANTDPNAKGYYTTDVSLTVSANDSGDYSGIDYLEYWIVCDGKKSESEKLYTYEDGTAVKAKVSFDDIKIIAADNNSNNVTVFAKAADRAGNISEEKEFDLSFCTTTPSVSVKFDDEQAEDADPEDVWYNTDRTATITITDRADVFDETAASNGIAFAEDTANGYTLSKWTSEGNVHSATVTFNSEGTYNWSYTYKNKADLDASVVLSGNNTSEFKIDKTAPTGVITAQSASWDSEGYDWNTLLEKITFGLYSSKTVSVGLKGNTGSDLLSGFRSVAYYVSNEETALTESALKELYESGKFDAARIEVSKDEMFTVYARIVDNAGNVAFIGTNGVIYDLTASDIGIEIMDSPNDKSFYGVNQVKEYTTEDGKTVRGIKADINVSDLKTGLYYSGINKIEWAVSMGTTQTQSGTLFEFRNAAPGKKDLVKDWTGSIIIDADKNNGKDVTLKVIVTDNAGNKSEKSVTINEINLDTLTSTVTVTGNAVKTQDGFGWYNSGRTAFITIIDRSSTFDGEAAKKGIIFELTDKDGKTIAASEGDVSVGEWNNSGNLHTISVMFNRDGNYSWHLDYTNKAGNTLSKKNISYGTSEFPMAFAIDKTVPHGTVSVSGYSWTDKLLSVLSFGIYNKNEFTLNIEASDNENISPVSVEYYLHNGAAALSWTKLDSLYNSKSFSTEAPELSGKQQFTVYIRVTDNAGNYIYVSSDGHIIDPTQTQLEVSAMEQPNENGIYGISEVGTVGDVQSGIRVSVGAKEADFADDTYSGIQEIRYEIKSRRTAKEAYSVTQSGTLYKFDYARASGNNTNGGTLTITDINKDTETYTVDDNVPSKEMLCRQWSGMLVVDAAMNNCCDVIVVVYVKDNAGNETSENITLDVDLTSPSISVDFDNNNAQNGTFFNAPRTSEVTFTERDHHFDQAAAEAIIKDNIKAVKFNGEAVSEAYSISWKADQTASDPDKNTHTATIKFEKDAHYTWGVSYTDNAGNKNMSVDTGDCAAPFDFTVDTEDPYGTVFINNSPWSEFFEVLTFGLFSNTKASVSVSADDAVSPVKIEYYKSNDDYGKKIDDLFSLKPIMSYDFKDAVNKRIIELESINTTEQFNVYVKITDEAGHSILINSDGYIVDTAISPVSVTAVTAANENGIYGRREVEADNGVILHIDANDTENSTAKYYSGIKTVSYNVTAVLDGKTVETQKETVLYKFEKTAPVKSDLLTNWSGDILIDAQKNNSSKVTVTVTVTDNAGNVSTDSIALDINITTPTIDISFDNNTALNGTYFNAPRTATVVITERTNHFNSVAATDGIVITAKDAEGNDVQNAYTISGWSDKENGSSPDAATHTATISFKKDANYTFAISYVGKAGNPNEEVAVGNSVAPYLFTVDTTLPEAEISVDNHAWDKLLNILTFGLYNNLRAEVKVTANDKTSPITVEYYKTNDPIVKNSAALEKLYKEGKFEEYKAFTVKTNEQFVVYVRITDNAGNFKYISSDGYIVDFAGPAITITPDEPNANKTYNKDVKIKVETSDSEPYSGIAKVEYWVVSKGKETQRQTLFAYDYTREEGANTNRGTLVITDWADGTEKVTTLNGNVPTQAQLYANWTGVFTVDASLNDSSDTKVYVGVTDNAGNYTEQKIALDIDVTDPVIKVAYDSTANANAKDGYFTARTATVEITERTVHFDPTAATNGIVITAVDAKGKEIENAYTISTWTTTEGETPDDAVHTATISYLADANYTFAITYTDKADNENMPVDVKGQKNPYKFTVDKSAPVGTVTAKSAEGREETWSSIVDSLTFGFWSNTKISLSDTSDDVTSPIQSVEYYMPVSEIASDNTTVLKKDALDEITVWQTFKPFDVTTNTQFTVYLKITDNAGNYTYIATNGLIVDEEHPVEESVAPEISVSPAKPVNGIYTDDVKVSIEVVDPMVGGTYSGLKEVRYAVFDRDSKTPDKATQDGTLFKFDMAYPKQSDLKQKWTGDITVSAAKNNSNNIQVVVYAVDNSLNAVDNSQKESKSYTVVKIDTTAPVIDIAYDNNAADSGTYFKANRTATVTVTERNFNADDVKVTITNTDGEIPAVIGWSNTTGTYSKDDATHTAKITYKADGDYTFAIEYTDLAGNKCKSVNYASGTVAAESFTIDKTIPTVNVSYNNNSALNSNYYQDPRTATIVINEHNFSTERINISMSATNDGSAVSIPSVNGWSASGDTHTATISFANDALYSFDISYTDLAGNVTADYNQDTFYIDNTDPELDITPETLAGSANNGEVKPVVTSSDTNFDQVTITLTGANRGQIKQFDGSYSDIHNGRVFSFANFAEEKDVDDIYTLSAKVTDKAGRSTEKAVTFSVNRFGSTYSISKDIEDLNNTYVKEAKDVVVTEINANALTNIKITLFKNNQTIVLNSGKDYKVDTTGGNGSWYKYVYTIFAKNFAEDGVYRISIHSEDAAGNIAENTLDTKDLELNFGIDSTSPTININNLESGTTYNLDNMTVQMSIADNLSLAKVTVYLDGEEYQSWSGESIDAIIEEGGNFAFDIAGDSTEAHTLKVVAVDAAGNELTEEAENFYVTTNLWVRYYNNKGAFYGSIAGVVAVTGLTIFLIVWKRRKDEEDSQKA